MAAWVDGLRAAGFDARAVDLPRGRAERAVGAFLAAMGEVPAHAERVVAGGHSFGGRVAALAAAARFEEGSAVAALVLLSYPLHRPGDPAAWRERTAHWPRLRCPVLLLSGEADPFARLPLLREAVAQLPQARLITYPRIGHGLLAVRDDALERIVAFLRELR